MLQLYNTALLPLRALVGLWAGWDGRRRGAREEWEERFARRLPRVEPGGAWIHGSSVGEARIVQAVAEELRRWRAGLPLSVSAYTRTGRRRLPAPPAVDAAFFLPLDFPRLPSRVLRSIRPSAMVLVETELWPNLLHEAARAGVRVGLVNGRLSPDKMSRYRRLRRLYDPLLAGLCRVGAQSEADGERFRELGVSERALSVTGNVKYDLPAPAFDRGELRRRIGLAGGRPVLVAGSTAPGEEAEVLEAAARVRESRSDLFLILAPRHPERAEEVARLAAARGFHLGRLSRGERRDDGLLVDTVGELAALYGVGDAAFVGGSLVPVGGHNPLEPAAVEVPVLFGRHVDHVREPAQALLREGGALQVADARELGRAWVSLLNDEALRARLTAGASRVLAAGRGALERTLELVTELLGKDR